MWKHKNFKYAKIAFIYYNTLNIIYQSNREMDTWYEDPLLNLSKIRNGSHNIPSKIRYA